MASTVRRVGDSRDKAGLQGPRGAEADGDRKPLAPGTNVRRSAGAGKIEAPRTFMGCELDHSQLTDWRADWELRGRERQVAPSPAQRHGARQPLRCHRCGRSSFLRDIRVGRPYRPALGQRRQEPMPRIAHFRAEADGGRGANQPCVLRQDAATDTVDEAERKFLEPVARYLAILREWSREHRLQDPEAHPPPEQP